VGTWLDSAAADLGFAEETSNKRTVPSPRKRMRAPSFPHAYALSIADRR
jgi:hypothetical protein